MAEAAMVTKFTEYHEQEMKVEWFPSTIMEPITLNIQWYIEHYHELYSDPNLLQRLKVPWDTDTRDSYLYDLLRGASQKDTIILAEIVPIIEHIKNNGGTKGNIEYFQSLFNEGYKFLIIDGQHRIDEIKKFFHLNELKIGEEPWRNPTGKPFRDFVLNGDIPYDLDGTFFQEWPKCLQVFVKANVRLITPIIQSGDIKQLKMLFAGANSAKPLTRFEHLIIEAWSEVQRFVVALTNPDTQSEHILNLTNKFSKFSDKYAPEKKGLTFCVTEMLLYLESEYGQNSSIPLYYTIKGVETILDDQYEPKKGNLKALKDIINIIANGLAPMQKSTALSRGSFCNSFVLICMLQDPKHFRRYQTNLPELRVKDPVRFMEWFCETEVVRINENRYQTDPNGKIKYKDNNPKKGALTNDHCYSGYLKTVWGKAHLEFRERKMLEDLLRDYKQLCNEGVLVEAGKSVSNPAERRATLAARSDWTDKEGKKLKVFNILKSGSEYDVGHIVHKSDGGDNSIENTQLELVSANRSKGNK